MCVRLRFHEGCGGGRLETKLSKNLQRLRVHRLSDFRLRQRLSRAAVSRFSARPLFQREGHPIQVFGTVNSFCKFFCFTVTLSNTALDGPRTCGAALIAVSFFRSTVFFKKVCRAVRMPHAMRWKSVPLQQQFYL